MAKLWLLIGKYCTIVLIAVVLAGLPDLSGSVYAQNNASGLPLPRFASLKSDEVNVRKGPGKEYPIDWVFRRAGLPVEIIKEYGHWRQIRDYQGSVGWIFQGLLSGRRTMVVLPWEIGKNAGAEIGKNAGADIGQSEGASGKPKMTPIYKDASRDGDVVVEVEPGVIGSVFNCDRTWCNVSVMSYRGWILQKTLWGVYAPEVIK